jgi:hypothetical protein
MFRKLLQDYPEIARTLRSRMTRHVLHVSAQFDEIGERLREIDASLR